MLKFSWSMERMLIVGCAVVMLVIIPAASFITHRIQPQPIPTQADSEPSAASVPDEDDVVQVLPQGSRAPVFDSTTLSGRSFTSKELLGHVAVLDFWATWCGPCKMAIPAVQDLHTRYAAQGVRVIGVSMDTDTVTSVKPYVAQMKMTYPILVNPDQNVAAANLYAASGLPSIYVLDKHGIVRWSVSGYFAGEEEIIAHVVDRLVKEK